MEMLSEVIDQITGNSSAHSVDNSDILHQEMNKALTEMMQQVDDIDGAMVCSVDGIAIAEHMKDGFDQHRFAAMSSALLALSENLAREGQKGTTQNVLIEGDSGNIFLMHAGTNMLLTVFAKDGSNLGLSLAFAKQAAEKIECLAQLAA